jgi:hypothetical protein
MLFLHGWTSTAGGRKPTYLKDHSYEVLNPALAEDNFDATVCIAPLTGATSWLHESLARLSKAT